MSVIPPQKKWVLEVFKETKGGCELRVRKSVSDITNYYYHNHPPESCFSLPTEPCCDRAFNQPSSQNVQQLHCLHHVLQGRGFRCRAGGGKKSFLSLFSVYMCKCILSRLFVVNSKGYVFFISNSSFFNQWFSCSQHLCHEQNFLICPCQFLIKNKQFCTKYRQNRYKVRLAYFQ